MKIGSYKNANDVNLQLKKYKETLDLESKLAQMYEQAFKSAFTPVGVAIPKPGAEMPKYASTEEELRDVQEQERNMIAKLQKIFKYPKDARQALDMYKAENFNPVDFNRLYGAFLEKNKDLDIATLTPAYFVRVWDKWFNKYRAQGDSLTEIGTADEKARQDLIKDVNAITKFFEQNQVGTRGQRSVWERKLRDDAVNIDSDDIEALKDIVDGTILNDFDDQEIKQVITNQEQEGKLPVRERAKLYKKLSDKIIREKTNAAIKEIKDEFFGRSARQILAEMRMRYEPEHPLASSLTPEDIAEALGTERKYEMDLEEALQEQKQLRDRTLARVRGINPNHELELENKINKVIHEALLSNPVNANDFGIKVYEKLNVGDEMERMDAILDIITLNDLWDSAREGEHVENPYLAPFRVELTPEERERAIAQVDRRREQYWKKVERKQEKREERRRREGRPIRTVEVKRTPQEKIVLDVMKFNERTSLKRIEEACEVLGVEPYRTNKGKIIKLQTLERLKPAAERYLDQQGYMDLGFGYVPIAEFAESESKSEPGSESEMLFSSSPHGFWSSPHLTPRGSLFSSPQTPAVVRPAIHSEFQTPTLSADEAKEIIGKIEESQRLSKGQINKIKQITRMNEREIETDITANEGREIINQLRQLGGTGLVHVHSLHPESHRGYLYTSPYAKIPSRQRVFIGHGIEGMSPTPTPTSEPTFTPQPKQTKGIKSRQLDKYVEFGNYIINRRQLYNQNKLNVKYKSGAGHREFPVRTVSQVMADIIKSILEEEKLPFKKLKELSKQEEQYLYNLIQRAKLDEQLGMGGFRDEEFQNDYKRFELLRGEILAGNDNVDMLKELRNYIMKFMATGRMAKSEGNGLLYEIHMLLLAR